MIVEQIMKTDVATLSPSDKISDAIRLLHEKKIRHIPIVDKNDSVVGIVSDRDVRDASPSIFQKTEDQDFENLIIENIMTKNVITAHPLDFVEEISAVFYEQKIGCLPVIQSKKLVGIVTETDLLYTLIQLTGAHQPGSQIEVKVENKAGMLSDVANIIKKRETNITSVLVYPDRNEDFKVLVFRVQTMNPLGIISDLIEEGYHVLWPNFEVPHHEE
ncbi:acetoin utilization AcuB family protein [Bacillus timonensis]|nr:acetoin utilization AcuB family protein [Bacillus timonensis]